MAKIYNLPVFECQCGYYTTIKTNAMKHSKTLACKDKIMSTQSKEFVLKEVSDKMELETNIVNNCISIEEKDAIIKNQEYVIKRQRKSIMMLTETVVECDDEKDNVGSGLIYFVEDVDIPDRGKVGRTKNTDIKKLKTRYATFASPKITCFYSNNINKVTSCWWIYVQIFPFMTNHNRGCRLIPAPYIDTLSFIRRRRVKSQK